MIEYVVDGKIAIVTGASGKDTELKIPEEIDGYVVSKIAEDAFSEDSIIKKVFIPKTVKVISSYAFSSCSKLTELVIADGAEVIEDWAFANCPITKLILPPSLKQIGPNAFLGSDCKPKVDDFLKMKNRPKQKRSFKNNACILPISVYEDFTNITPAFITKQSDYIDSQFDSLERGYSDYFSLDIPFIFHDDQFVIAFFSDTKLDYFSVDLNNDTKKQIGIYKEDDPTYVAARIDVFSHAKKAATIDAKLPYLEKAVFTIVNQVELEIDEKFCYYLTVSADFECYGNGNVDFEFSFNAFDDLFGKYQTEADGHLISSEELTKINSELVEERRYVIAQFIRSIVGAPVTTYLLKLYDAVMDNGLADQETLLAYRNDQLDNIYYGLTNLQTLTDYAFNIDDHLKFLGQVTNMKIKDISDKYSIYLVSEEGIELSKTDIENYKSNLGNVKENYYLHAEMIEELFLKLRDMNRRFSMLAFKK